MIETLRAVLSLQATLLLLVLAGAAGKKLGVITAGFQNGLSRFLVYMVLPCSVLNAFSKGNTVGIWEQSLQILAVMSAVHVFYILLNLLLYRRKSPGRGAVLRFAVLCPNTNFMGILVAGYRRYLWRDRNAFALRGAFPGPGFYPYGRYILFCYRTVRTMGNSSF